jgi:hypothetical protein
LISFCLIFLKKKKGRYNELFPITSVNNINKIDFIYFGSCIQFFKNYKSFLNKIFGKKPKFILFSGTSFYYNSSFKKKTLVVKQTIILPSTVYLFFFNFEKFVKFF